MRQMRFVRIGNEKYTTAREIEDLAEALGGYTAYVYDGNHGGPRHPGTVVVAAIRSILKDQAMRTALGLKPTDSCRMEFGVHKPNDDVINYLIHEKVISKADLNSKDYSLNLFNETAAQAVITFLRKGKQSDLTATNTKVLPRLFTGCIMRELKTAKPDQRPRTKGLF